MEWRDKPAAAASEWPTIWSRYFGAVDGESRALMESAPNVNKRRTCATTESCNSGVDGKIFGASSVTAVPNPGRAPARSLCARSMAFGHSTKAARYLRQSLLTPVRTED